MSTKTKRYIDMWYGDDLSEVDKVDVTFYPNEGVYRGNIYKGGKMVGDYSTSSSLDIERMFPQLIIDWDSRY